MHEMPNEAVALFLNKLYVSIIDPDRSRDAFKRTKGFTDPDFLAKAVALSNEVDHLVFDVSFMGDFKEIKQFLLNSPHDVLDVLIFRFNLVTLSLKNEPGTLHYKDRPDILAAFRLYLIEDDRVRNGPWPTH